jgi:hypothetical protein
MSKQSDFSTRALNALGLADTHPIYIAVPVGIVTGIVTLTVYRYYMGSSRQPEQQRKEVETKLAHVSSVLLLPRRAFFTFA